MLVAVLHPGEGHAGDEENQPQLGAGVAQEIDRDGVGAQNHRGPHREEQEKENLQTGGDGLVRRPAAAKSQVLRREVGYRRRQSHGGERQKHRVHRHDELVQPHHLRPHQPGQHHPVEKAQYLGDGAQRGEKQRALPGGQHFFRQDNPPSRQSIREGADLSIFGCVLERLVL